MAPLGLTRFPRWLDVGGVMAALDRFGEGD